MNLRDTIRLYHIPEYKQPVAFAVFDSPAPRYSTKNGGRIFPFGVGLTLESMPRFLAAATPAQVEFQISFRPGNEPTPIVVLDFSREELDSALVWKPPPNHLTSLHALLKEAKTWANTEGSMEDDWNNPENGFRRTRLVVGPEKVTKRARLRWIMAWGLSVWEAEGITQEEQFERTQKLAEAYRLEPWKTLSTFQKTLNKMKKP